MIEHVEAVAAERGIRTLPSHYSPPIGFAGIELFLTGADSHRFLDVRSARFQSAAHETLQYFTVKHPSMLRGSRSMCAGLFTLYGHNSHFWEGLTFGGTIDVASLHDYTRVTITSPAPVFILLDQSDTIQQILLDEMMALVARHRAAEHETDSEFAHRLATTDPYLLFLSALTTLDAMVKHGPPSIMGAHHLEVKRAVQRMVDAVRKADGWPEHLPMLDELL